MRQTLRDMQKTKAILVSIVLLFGFVSQAAPVAGITLEMPPDAAPAVHTARDELEHYITLAAKSISVGGRKLGKIVLSVDERLDEEAWEISETDGALRLAGGSPRGVLYAAYHFLEDCLDIHWWTPWDESVPSAKDWGFESLSLSGKPTFFCRDLYRNPSKLIGDLAGFAVRNRMNRAGDIKIPAKYGGARTFGPPYFVHTFNRYMDGVKDHPEFLALIDGKRDGGQYSGQLCLTNQGLRDFIVSKMLGFIESSYAKADAEGVPRPVYFDLSQNDGQRFCECEECTKLVKETSLTDVLIDFVNYVAEKVGERHPEILVTTLAYHNTVSAPKKIMPRENVVVRLCNTNLACSDINAPRFDKYRHTVEQWSKVAKHLMCWEYSIAHWPYPDDMGAQRMCQFYRKNNFEAIFVEMSYDDFMLDFYDMKAWMYAKIMENADADYEATRQVFLNGYFGKAAPYVDKWRKMLEKAEARGDTKVVTRLRPLGFDVFNLDELVEAHRLFDEASKIVAGDNVLETRLMRARAPFNILTGQRLSRYMDDWRRRGGTPEDFPIDRDRLAEEMRRLWKTDTARFKPEKINELQNVLESRISIMQNLGHDIKTVPEPAEFKGHKVQHFCPSMLTLHNNPNMTLIKDPDAREGCAYQILCEPREQFFVLPFEAGCYDVARAKKTHVKQWDTPPKERGFQWLNLGKDRLCLSHYVYLTRSWELQALMHQYLGTGAKDLDIWIRLKFEGPKFYPEDIGKVNRIVVDSISFVEQ